MTKVLKSCRAAAFAVACVLASAAAATAPSDVAVGSAAPDAAAPPVEAYALQTEMVVHNWVVCVSAPLAEQLAHAREASLDEARSAYTSLATARSCGKFSELRVILRERLYASAADSGHDTRVFGALVNLSGGWATAFLVSGSLPDE